jgi:DNA-directed RNA polymerase sigma subunit (sigma70/sigma32)
LLEAINNVNQIFCILFQETEREPTLDEISEKMGVPASHVQMLMEIAQVN